MSDWDPSKLVAGLNKWRDEATEAAVDALRAQGEDWLRLGNQLAPVEKGDLRASGTVVVDEGNMTVAVGWGAGLDRDYAVIQHENTGFQHPGGGGAKWGELSARHTATQAAQKIADTIRGRVG